MSINKEELDEQFKKILEARDKICNNFCPLSKIQGGEDGLSDNTQQIIK